jgi:hypothetical protein
VSHPTDEAKFTIIFPDRKAPGTRSIEIYYHDNRDHPLTDLKDIAFVKDEAGGVSSLTWTISHPSTDRSYRVRWDWRDAADSRHAGN